MAVKLSNGSKSHGREAATARADEDVATGEADTGNSDISQTQGKGKDRKGKSKSNGKPKAKSDAQGQERIQRLDQFYSKKKRQVYFVPLPKPPPKSRSQDRSRTSFLRSAESYAIRASQRVPKSISDRLYSKMRYLRCMRTSRACN
jgi:hypothetical protein